MAGFCARLHCKHRIALFIYHWCDYFFKIISSIKLENYITKTVIHLSCQYPNNKICIDMCVCMYLQTLSEFQNMHNFLWRVVPQSPTSRVATVHKPHCFKNVKKLPMKHTVKTKHMVAELFDRQIKIWDNDFQKKKGRKVLLLCNFLLLQ